MITKPMAAIGLAATLAMSGAAYAQTSMPNGVNAANKSTTGQASTAKTQKLSKAHQNFLKQAIQSDLAEVQMGQLAQQNGQDSDVKQFGQMLQQDHGQHLQQAQQMAQQNGMTPPKEPSTASKKMHDRLKMSSSQFDKAFAKDMVSDHKKDIAKYQKAAKGNGPLVQFAQQTLPVLQKHLQTAQSIESKGAAVGSGNRAK